MNEARVAIIHDLEPARRYRYEALAHQFRLSFSSLACSLSFVSFIILHPSEPCQYPLMDSTYVLSLVGMLLALFAALAPCFYRITYTDDQWGTVEENISLFFRLFQGPDSNTIAAFVFLLFAVFSCSCGGRLLGLSYKHGFGEQEEIMPGVTCCLSTWFLLDATLGFLSLVSNRRLCCVERQL